MPGVNIIAMYSYDDYRCISYNILTTMHRGICSNEENDPVRERLKSYFEPLAEAYQEIVTKQEREFYGLRDFYR